MTIKAIVRKCGPKATYCLETNALSQWFYEDIVISDFMSWKHLMLAFDTIYMTEDVEQTLQRRPEHDFYIDDTLVNACTFVRAYDEGFAVDEELKKNMTRNSDEEVSFTEDLEKNITQNAGVMDEYALGTVMLGSREISPPRDGSQDDEISITETLVMNIL